MGKQNSHAFDARYSEINETLKKVKRSDYKTLKEYNQARMKAIENLGISRKDMLKVLGLHSRKDGV